MLICHGIGKQQSIKFLKSRVGRQATGSNTIVIEIDTNTNPTDESASLALNTQQQLDENTEMANTIIDATLNGEVV